MSHGQQVFWVSSRCWIANRRRYPVGSGSESRWDVRWCVSRKCFCSTSRSPISTPQLRAQMRIEIGGLQRRLKTTTVYVTHDQVEAMTLGDRIVVLADGRIRADRAANRSLSKPRQPIRGRIHWHAGDELSSGSIGPGRRSTCTSAPKPRVSSCEAGVLPVASTEPVTLGIRPEDLRVQAIDLPKTGALDHSPTHGATDGDTLTGRVVLVERLGGTSHVHFQGRVPTDCWRQLRANHRLSSETNITARVPAARVHLFGGDGRSIGQSSPLRT